MEPTKEEILEYCLQIQKEQPEITKEKMQELIKKKFYNPSSNKIDEAKGAMPKKEGDETKKKSWVKKGIIGVIAIVVGLSFLIPMLSPSQKGYVEETAQIRIAKPQVKGNVRSILGDFKNQVRFEERYGGGKVIQIVGLVERVTKIDKGRQYEVVLNQGGDLDFYKISCYFDAVACSTEITKLRAGQLVFVSTKLNEIRNGEPIFFPSAIMENEKK